MSELEHNVLGGAFAVCAAILFFGAVPYYVLRHVGPGKPPPLPSGKVSIAGFGLLDVIGVSLFFGFYALVWSSKKGASGGDLPALDAWMLLNALMSQVFFVVVVVAILAWRVSLVKAWELQWRTWPWIFLYVPAALILMMGLEQLLIVTGYFEWMAEMTGNNPDEPSQETVRLLKESKDPVTLGLLALVACAGAPVMEEVVFRGYIYPAVKRFSNMWVAVVFSSILFGVVHTDLTSFLPLVVFGVILAVLYERTGSLWMPVTVHFAFNAWTVVIQLVAKLRPEWLEKLEKNAAIIGFG